MAVLLHIDTALKKAFVGLSNNGTLLLELSNEYQADHAAFVQPAIQQLLNTTGVSAADLDAIGVTSGPGSYTGLRVGMASAKGICYALNKPLLAVSTLEVMALAAAEAFPGYELYAPMIDARRDEVYTALYGAKGTQVLTPVAAILHESLFSNLISDKKLLCFGSGAHKWQKMMAGSENIYFDEVSYDGKHLAELVFNNYRSKQYCDLAYTEPLYLKAFYSGSAGLSK